MKSIFLALLFMTASLHGAKQKMGLETPRIRQGFSTREAIIREITAIQALDNQKDNLELQKVINENKIYF